MARVLIGTSGWNYRHWRGVFYPPGLPQREWLRFYAGAFPTVEINYSFYRLPTGAAFDRWRAEAPGGFVFAVKASRFITHLKRIGDVTGPLETFFSRARRLGDALGPVLFQLPPKMRRDDERLAAFLARLPHDVACAMEFRDPRWNVEPVWDLLRRHGVAYCVMVHPALPEEVVATAPFAYVRFHAPETGVRFGERALRRWAAAIRELCGGDRRVYAYFNNDPEGAAIEDARTLRRLLGAPAAPRVARG